MPTIKIESIHWKDTLEVRHRVLWPNKPKEFCLVEGDDNANHFGAYTDSILIGVASTYSDNGSVRLRKFAVDKAFQGKGIGSQLLRHIIKIQRNEGVACFWCDARESALNFYQRFGMSKEGDLFYKSGVPYFKMSLNPLA